MPAMSAKPAMSEQGIHSQSVVLPTPCSLADFVEGLSAALERQHLNGQHLNGLLRVLRPG